MTLLINKADARIAISAAVAKHWCLKDCMTFVIGDAVRRNQCNTIKNNKRHYFLFCAAYITHKKGSFFAIEGFAKSGLANYGYELHLYGRCHDPIKNEIEELTRKLNIQGAVKLFSFTDDLQDVYANAIAFVMASEVEGLGRVTIEAMFEGCPVLARKSGGSLDLIEEGKTGFFFETVDELAFLMKMVAKQDLHEIAVEAQGFVNANFTEDVYKERIMSIYRSLT